jgi:hypothetical protein
MNAMTVQHADADFFGGRDHDFFGGRQFFGGRRRADFFGGRDHDFFGGRRAGFFGGR